MKQIIRILIYKYYYFLFVFEELYWSYKRIKRRYIFLNVVFIYLNTAVRYDTLLVAGTSSINRYVTYIESISKLSAFRILFNDKYKLGKAFQRSDSYRKKRTKCGCLNYAIYDYFYTYLARKYKHIKYLCVYISSHITVYLYIYYILYMCKFMGLSKISLFYLYF